MLLSGTQKAPPLYQNGSDASFDIWSDYVLVFDHVVEEIDFINQLKKLLSIYPYFSGRQMDIDSSEPYISANGEGLLFESVRYNETLPGKDLITLAKLDKTTYLTDQSEQTRGESDPIFQVKLSIFRDGTILGLSLWHAVCDGTSFMMFLQAWSDIANNRAVNLPDYTRITRDENVIGKKHKNVKYIGDIYSKIKSRRCQEQALYLHSNFVTQLYELCVEEVDPNEMLTKDDVLFAFIWKKIVFSQILSADEEVSMTLVYDARPLLGIDQNYFGNLLAFPCVCKTKQFIDDLSVANLAVLIRQAAFDLLEDADDLKVEIDCFNEKMLEGVLYDYCFYGIYKTLIGGVALNNLSIAPLYDIDLGFGKPVFVDSPFEPSVRCINAFPAPQGNDSVFLKINLPADEMQEFVKAIEHHESEGVQLL
jgi:shikimate O-hydroxycinnamoyltransferase